MREKSVFHAYDVRGIWQKELDVPTARRIGWSAGEYYKKISGKPAPMLLVGIDGRESSQPLSEALITGLSAAGAQVVFGGMMTTPMLYWAVNDAAADGGVMVTASHNPAEYNGFKFMQDRALPVFLSGGLEKIEEGMRRAPATPHVARIEVVSLQERYAAFLKEKFPTLFSNQFPEIKIVADNGNGMVSFPLDQLLGALPWIKPIKLFWERDPQFQGRGPNPNAPGALRALARAVQRQHAAFGVAFDGDGDRIVFVDEKGSLVPGDWITAWFSRAYLLRHPLSTVVLPIGTSRIVEETIRAHGGRAAFSRRGNVFMCNTMESQNAIFGGERTGHYYFRDFFFRDSAVFAFLSFLSFFAESEDSAGPFSDTVVAHFAKYSASGEMSIPSEDAGAAISKAKRAYASSAKHISELDGFFADCGEWWFLVRPSHTEPVVRLVVEGNDAKTVREKTDQLLGLLKDA